MWSFCLNAVLGLLGVITLMFTCGDLEELSHTPYGLPIISMYYEATGSKVATMVIVSLLIIPLFASVVAVVATASRQARAFARDGGLPCSRFLDRVSYTCCIQIGNH
jgi:amino acid transporter